MATSDGRAAQSVNKLVHFKAKWAYGYISWKSSIATNKLVHVKAKWAYVPGSLLCDTLTTRTSLLKNVGLLLSVLKCMRHCKKSRLEWLWGVQVCMIFIDWDRVSSQTAIKAGLVCGHYNPVVLYHQLSRSMHTWVLPMHQCYAAQNQLCSRAAYISPLLIFFMAITVQPHD